MADLPIDAFPDRTGGVTLLAQPQEFAFADVAPDGSLRYVSPFGEARWGWSEGAMVPDEMLFMLAELAPGASWELPFMQGGLYVNGIRRGESDGWIVVGYEGRPVAEDPENEPLDALVRRMPVAALRMQVDGTVVFANPAFARMTGYPMDEVVGYRFWTRVIVEDDAPAFEEALRHVTDAEGSRVRFAYRTAHGGIQHVDMHLVLNEAYFVEAVVLDRPVDSEDALLLHARLDAEQATRQKTAFIAMLSHEIRTPLGSIRGYADLLAREVADLETAGTPLPPTVREFVDSIDDRAGRLVNLVRDLLELSAIEMGHVSVENVPVRLRAVLGEVIPTITEELERKRLTLAVDVPGDPVVLSDARRLELVLGRLLSNALKFTAEGSITVRAREEDGTLAIEIQDTGIGISEAFRRRMFAPFNQEDDWLNRGHGGIGLGLTLVQRAVELLGGRLEVDSRKEAGSTFRVVLPAATLALD